MRLGALRAAFAAGVMCAAIAAGCGSAAPRAPVASSPVSPSAVSSASGQSSSGGSSSGGSSAGQSSSGQGGSGAAPSGDLVLEFAGDVHFTGRTATLLDRDPTTAFGPIADTLRGADFTMVNLETAVTERGTEEPKTYHFRTRAAAFDALRAAGIDAVTMANNHVLDYGQVGLLDTLDNARAKRFPVVGIGHNVAEAYAPLVVPVKGRKIAVLAFSQIHELAFTWAAKADRPGVAMAMDVARATAAVAAARKAADLVIVFNHWGVEGNSCATPEQKAFAAQLARAGADIVIGSHAHTLLGDGWLGPTYVQYGLANFLWYATSRSTETGVLRLTVRGRSVVRNEFLPAVVSSTGQPVLLVGAAAAKLSQRYAGLRRCTGLANSPS